MQNPNKPGPDLTTLLADYERENELYRRLTLPQEERRRLTHWQGGYRWFQSPNVVCLEKARFVRTRHAATIKRHAR
jgi:hypothetical protein